MPIISNFPGGGKDGAPGKSAFQSAQENGYTGSEAEFYAALVALKDGPFLPKPTGTAGQVLGFTADNTVGAVDRKRVEVMLTVSDGPDGKKVYTLDKTYDEILGYINSGRDVVIIAPGNGAGVFYYSRMSTAGALWFEQYIPALRAGAPDPKWTIYNGAENVRIAIAPDNTCTITIFPNRASYCQFAPGVHDLTSTNVQKAIEEVNAKIPANIPKAPKSHYLVLPASGWVESAVPGCKVQDAVVPGVMLDESKQLVLAMPEASSILDYIKSGILCAVQDINALQFICQAVPTSDIGVYVTMQEVGA